MKQLNSTHIAMLLLPALLAWLVPSERLRGERPDWLPNEQGAIQVREPYAVRGSEKIPRRGLPPTIRSEEITPREMSLDEVLGEALRNTRAIRILSGVGAASTGQTIYSPGIQNTQIDQARAVFDPTLTISNNFLRNETPTAIFDPADPNRALIRGSRNDLHDFRLDLNQRLTNGATAGLRVNANRSRLNPGIVPLNPQTNSDVELSLTQPLLSGRGTDVNAVPIVLAFLNTEQSYFRLKDDLQLMVLGVIQGYWELVQARTNLWVLQQQIRQAEYAFELAENRRLTNIANVGDAAQARASLANFRASLIAAEADILNRVASLRGIMGLPPSDEFTIVPTTPPSIIEPSFDWESLLQLAETRRPDLVELKLILDADHQRILLARNQAQARLDAIALYRWNGIEGVMPIGDRLRSDGGAHTDWTLGVNFSVPVTLRAARANLRQNELLLANDRVNLQQGLLQASHQLAFTLRNLDQLYAQYLAFREARAAATENLELQLERFQNRITNFLDALQAINTWGNAVTSEARSVTEINAALAQLEQQSGSILETHGIRLVEERYCAVGPLGLGPLGAIGKGRAFPAEIRPTENHERYENSTRPAEEVFDLVTPKTGTESDLRRLPPPEPEPGSESPKMHPSS